MLEASLLSGALPRTVSIAGLVGISYLLIARSHLWWRRTVVVCIAGAASVVIAANGVMEIWKPFPDPLSGRILFWAGFAILGVILAAVRLRQTTWRRCALLIPALCLVVLTSGVKVNAFYGYFPNLAAVLNGVTVKESAFAEVAEPKPTLALRANGPLSLSWAPPENLPAAGKVTRVAIPGAKSGFHARAAVIYAPPAYLATPRPLLPVLMLMAGQPGGPGDWLVAGELSKIMDSFAASHGGLAPIVIVPDATGGSLSNPMCMNSALGQVETYLAEDVPDWLRSHLQVDPDPGHWAVGGFSYGGTCSFQLAVRRPRQFPTFLDISGQREPTLGNRERTVSAAFGGDLNQFRDSNPLDILARSNLPAIAGIIAVGINDQEYGPQARDVYDALRRAGVSARLVNYPGNHSWSIATAALRSSLPWIAARVNLLPSQ